MQSLRIFSHFRCEPKVFSPKEPAIGSLVEEALFPGSEGRRWEPSKVPEATWPHWLQWTRGRTLAFSMGTCIGMFPKGHYTCSIPSSFQEAQELTCQVGRVVHWQGLSHSL